MIDTWFDDKVEKKVYVPRVRDNNTKEVKTDFMGDYTQTVVPRERLKDEHADQVFEDWVNEVDSYNGIKRERNKNYHEESKR